MIMHRVEDATGQLEGALTREGKAHVPLVDSEALWNTGDWCVTL